MDKIILFCVNMLFIDFYWRTLEYCFYGKTTFRVVDLIIGITWSAMATYFIAERWGCDERSF